MLVSESVLRELYPRDLGLESPNPANQYQLSRHNLGSFSSLGLGIPYRWAQRMAGLHFVSCDTTEQQQKVHILVKNVYMSCDINIKNSCSVCKTKN